MQGNQSRARPRFKLPYRVAAAGGLTAAAAGWGTAEAFASYQRRRGGRPLPRPVRVALGVGAGVGFAVNYYLPVGFRREAPDRVFFTFDDGPDPEITPRVLDALAKAGSKATFFVLGEAVARAPHLARRIIEEGHEIGIHGYRHTPVTFLSPLRIVRDLKQTFQSVEDAGVAAPIRLYRPPYLLRGPGLGPALRATELQLEMLTLDSRDYLLRSPKPIHDRVVDDLLVGDVVVFHDAGETGRATAEALPGILEDIHERGWRSITLSAVSRRGAHRMIAR